MNRYIPIAIVTVGFFGVAVAQELPSFEQVDSDRDGLISQEEAAAVEGLDFVTADANQDGSIDREEYAVVSGR